MKSTPRFCTGRSARSPVLLFAVGMILSAPLPSLGAVGPRTLFREEPPSVRAHVLPQPKPKRERLVRIDPAALTALSSRSMRRGFKPGIALNLFDDESHIPVWDRPRLKRDGSFSAWGHLEGVPGGWIVLAENKGVVSGEAFVPGRGLFRIGYQGGGLHRIQEVDAEDGENGPRDVALPPGID